MIRKIAKATLLFVAFTGFCIAVVLDYLQNGARETQDYHND
jgi:preprotein translocase subunit Sss1